MWSSDNVRGARGVVQQGGQLAAGVRARAHLQDLLRGAVAQDHAAQDRLHRTLQGDTIIMVYTYSYMSAKVTLCICLSGLNA